MEKPKFVTMILYLIPFPLKQENKIIDIRIYIIIIKNHIFICSGFVVT